MVVMQMDHILSLRPHVAVNTIGRLGGYYEGTVPGQSGWCTADLEENAEWTPAAAIQVLWGLPISQGTLHNNRVLVTFRQRVSRGKIPMLNCQGQLNDGWHPRHVVGIELRSNNKHTSLHTWQKDLEFDPCPRIIWEKCLFPINSPTCCLHVLVHSRFRSVHNLIWF